MDGGGKRGSSAHGRVVPLGLARGGLALRPTPLLLGSCLALLALALALYLGARATSAFALRSIEVRGGSSELAEDVRRVLAPSLGRSLTSLDRKQVEDRVLGLPEVAAASVDRAFPHTVVVRIRPERPVAAIRRGADSWTVSARGRVVAQLPIGTRPELPRVWLPATVPVRLGETLVDGRARALARAVAPLASRRLGVSVRTAALEEDGLTFVLASGIDLRLGEPRNLELKLAVARLVVHDLNGFDYLDLSVPDRPVAGRNPRLSAQGRG